MLPPVRLRCEPCPSHFAFVLIASKRAVTYTFVQVEEVPAGVGNRIASSPSDALAFGRALIVA